MHLSALLYCDLTDQNEKHQCAWSTDHVENPNVIRSCREVLEADKLLKRCQTTRGRHATTAEIGLSHSFDHIQMLATTNAMSQWELETLSAKLERVFLSCGSYEAAIWAAGTAVDLMERLLPQRYRMRTIVQPTSKRGVHGPGGLEWGSNHRPPTTITFAKARKHQNQCSLSINYT